MGLETGDYIDDLVITNPVGSTDLVSTADDHIRLLKKVVKQSFPNVSAEISFTPTEANILSGATVTTAELNYLDITAAGTGEASKALVLDSNKEITGIKRIEAKDDNPDIRINETDGPANEKIWRWQASGGSLEFQAIDDVGGGNAIYGITRTGATVDTFNISATTTTVNALAATTITSNVDYTAQYLHMTNGSAELSFDTSATDGYGKRRITCNDGGGHFNIRSSNRYSSGDVYTTTGDGAVHIQMTSDGANGQLDFYVADTGTADSAITWADAVRLTTTDFTYGGNSIRHDGNTHHGRVNSSGTALRLPSGWSSSQLAGTGNYQVTHNLGHTNYTVVATSEGAAYVDSIAKFSNNFQISFKDDAGTDVNQFFNFILIED